MASGSVNSPTTPHDARVTADKLIETQLGRVRRHIRFTDLVAGILVLVAGVVAFLTLAAVVDHWIVGLGPIARWLALATLIVAAAWHLAVNVVPLLLRRINPAYAAQTIERGEPSLKNSLLNYLLLRREKEGVAGLIYQAVQQRAAADVSTVQVDQTVDRTVMIRAGYVLVTIMALTAAYKILSPKDPFQTFRRIAAPWSDIARPARVMIDSVEPGDAEVLQGKTVEISAMVRGARSSEPVTLTFSTVDGQVADRTVAMKLDSAGLRFTTPFPAEEAGLQQDVIYRITAGDASTSNYRLRVSPAPTMTVESVEYDFPAYTLRQREVVDRQGDIKAVEGTRVTVRARANQSIKSAAVVLGSSDASSALRDVRERLQMEFRDVAAWRAWTLELAADRRSAKYSAYQTTFMNQTGIASQDPVTYRIEVVPDLAPELAILTPSKETVRIPVSGEQKIEIRGIDPDFGLTAVRLKAVCAGKEILDKSLFENSVGQAGQIVVEFSFRPSDYKLSAGSQVTYWAVATDNRVTNTSPQPNSSRSPNRTLIVVEDPPQQQAKPGEPNADPSQQQDDTKPMPKEAQSGDKRQDPGTSDPPEEQAKSSENQKSTKSDQGKQKSQKSEDKSKSGQQSGNQSQQKGGSQGTGESQTTEGQEGNQQRGGNSGSDQPSTSQPGQGAKGEKSGGTTPQSQQPQPPGSQEPTPGSDPTAAGEVREGSQPGQRSEPVHDGEVFERALERLKKESGQQDQPAQEKSPENSGEGTSQEKSNSDGSPQTAKSQDRDGQPPGSQDNHPPTESPQKSGNEKSAAKSASGNAQSTDKSSADNSTEKSPANSPPQRSEKENEPGKSAKGTPGEKGGQKKKSDPSSAGNPQEKTGGPKESGSNDRSPAGAGQKNDDKTGSGDKTNSGEKKMSQQPDQAAPKTGDPPPPNQNDRPSDSKGQESGDRSGGGKKGGGQGANQGGKDNAGSNTPSDNGAGAAQDSGDGDKSSSAGKQQTAPKPNGSASNEKGPGSQSKSDPNGQQPSPQSTPESSSQPTNPNDQSKAGKTGSSGKAPSNSGAPTGGGQPSDGTAGTPSANTENEAADDPNLEYSRRATDMVLEYLKDQQKKPDDRLLDELGWTAEDMQNFLERWQKLKQSAAEDPAARRELDETLRGLGLRPQRDTKRSGGSKSDDVRGLRESGLKSSPPSSYQEQFNAFKKGTARSK